MGQASEHGGVLLISAVFSRYEEALDWAKQRMGREWGPVALESERFEFEETEYYEPSMGAGLKKQFLAFERPFDPGKMAEVKLLTNGWEDEYASLGRHPEARPLNLDPGYITAAKLVLASTKDYTQRIYLGQGVFAEITLFFQRKQWQVGPWTFPDYRRADYHAFFTECRDYFRRLPRTTEE